MISMLPHTIPPCTHQENRPLWSVMIPVYNGAALLPETLESILVQAPGPEQMQIQVVDDASVDADVKSLVERIGKGRVLYYRQAHNVGSLKNFETCLRLAQGHLVHLLHADDRVRPGYYQKIGHLFERFPQAGAAFCRYDTIDEEGKVRWHHFTESSEDGILGDWLLKIAQKQRLQFCCITVRREVYEKLGSYYGVHYGEDWEMWARIAAHYEVAYTPEILAEYRIHTNSISSRSYTNAQNIRDIRWVIGAIQQLVPEEKRKKVKKAASRNYAHYAMIIANNLWHQTRDKKIAGLQIREALKMHTDPSMLFKAAKIYTKMLINRV